jgi:hypothetical protein
MLVTGCRDAVIERNYCVTNGKQGDGYSAGGIHINGARNVCVRHNLMATQEPINAGAAGPNVDMLESRAVASSDNDGGFVRFSIPDANQIAVGLKLYIYGHSVAAYNGLHNVTEKSGSAYTTDVPYTSNGTGGRFSIVTDNVAIYGNVVFGVGMTIGYSGGWVDTDVDCNGVQNVVAEHNVIHEFPAANTVNSTAAPVRVKLYADTPSNEPTPQVGTGSMQPELGNAIRENNITRDSGTSAIAVRIGHSATLPALAADFYVATSTALDGFEDNTADAVTFADAVNGDFRITNSGPWDNWFPADMPFSPSLSKAWTPD